MGRLIDGKLDGWIDRNINGQIDIDGKLYRLEDRRRDRYMYIVYI